MAITIDGTEFADLDTSEPLCEMDFVPGPIEGKYDEFHLVGVEGSYSSRGGFVAQNLVALLRYRYSDRETALETFSGHIAVWSGGAPFEITAPDGQSYPRCRYIGHNIRNRGPVGDSSGTFFLIAEVQFRALAPGE